MVFLCMSGDTCRDDGYYVFGDLLVYVSNRRFQLMLPVFGWFELQLLGHQKLSMVLMEWHTSTGDLLPTIYGLTLSCLLSVANGIHFQGLLVLSDLLVTVSVLALSDLLANQNDFSSGLMVMVSVLALSGFVANRSVLVSSSGLLVMASVLALSDGLLANRSVLVFSIGLLVMVKVLVSSDGYLVRLNVLVLCDFLAMMVSVDLWRVPVFWNYRDHPKVEALVLCDDGDGGGDDEVVEFPE